MISRVVFLALISAALGLGIGSVSQNTAKFPPSYVQTLRPIGSKILVTNFQTLPIDFPQSNNNPLAYVVAISEDLEGEIEYITSPQQQVYADYSRNRDDISVTQTDFLRVGDIVMLNAIGSNDPCRVPVTLNQLSSTVEGLANYCLLDDWVTQILGVVNIGQQYIHGYNYLKASPTSDGLVDGVIGGVAGVGGINSATANVVSIADVSVVEGDAGAVNANLVVSLAEPATSPVQVVVIIEGGTVSPNEIGAPVGTRFTVNIPTGLTSPLVAVTVPIIADTLAEPIEWLDVRIVSASGAVISQSQNVGTITIIDDDTPAVVSVEVVAPAVVTEPTPPATQSITFQFTLDRPLNSATTINWSLTGFGASPATPAGGGADVTIPGGLSTGTVTFAPLATMQTLVVTVVRDFAPEFDEILRLTITGTPQSVTINPNANTADATIQSPDRVTLTFGAPIANVAGGQTATIPVSLINAANGNAVALPIPITINFTYGGTAVQGTDYTPTPSLTIPVGANNGDLIIPTIATASGNLLDVIVSFGTTSAGQFTDPAGPAFTFNIQQ